MAWAQLILFLITNMPSIIKSIREIMAIFDNDAAEVKLALKEMPEMFRDAVEKEDMSRIRAFAEARKHRRAERKAERRAR